MKTMNGLDLSILAIYLMIVFWIGLKWTKEAGKSTDHFFVANRGLPWWILGISMAVSYTHLRAHETKANLV